jgi:hypothetical protein
MNITGGTNLTGIRLIDKYRVPNAPTIGTATKTGGNSATVSFTAPLFDGNTPITSYTAVSSPGGLTGTLSQSGSGTITVNGLTAGTNYTFVVYATNIVGNSSNSAASNQITTDGLPSQVSYTTAGTFSWTAPAGVTSVSVVAIGGGGGGAGYSTLSAGGGGGGGLGYKNNITVVPGQNYTVVVGNGTTLNTTINTTIAGTSYFINSSTVAGLGGTSGLASGGGLGGTYVGDGGGDGGKGGSCGGGGPNGGGGGGAGGYSGTGGAGATTSPSIANATAGTGGGGGGGGRSLQPTGTQGYGGNGGGTGLLGQGSDGGAGTSAATPSNGGVGSGGSNRLYGGGGGGWNSTGGVGAVRIIWPGDQRQFPSTRTANE